MLKDFPALAQLVALVQDPQISLQTLTEAVVATADAAPESPFSLAWAALNTPVARQRLGLAFDGLINNLHIVDPQALPSAWRSWGQAAPNSTTLTVRAIPLLLTAPGPLTAGLAETLLGLLYTQCDFPAGSRLMLLPHFLTAETLPSPGMQRAFVAALLRDEVPDAAPARHDGALSLRYLLLLVQAPDAEAVAERLADHLDLQWAGTMISCLESALGGSATVLAPGQLFAAQVDGQAYLRRARVVEWLFPLEDVQIPPLAQVSFHDGPPESSVRLGFFTRQGEFMGGLDLPWALWETPQQVIEGLVADLRPRGVAQLIMVDEVLPAMRAADGAPEFPELAARDLLEAGGA